MILLKVDPNAPLSYSIGTLQTCKISSGEFFGIFDGSPHFKNRNFEDFQQRAASEVSNPVLKGIVGFWLELAFWEER